MVCRQARAGRANCNLSVGEQRNLSTSSFRPPGGPTPTRGFFYPGDSVDLAARPGPFAVPTTLSPDGRFAPCASSPATSAEPRRRSRSSRSAAGHCRILRVERYPSAGYATLEAHPGGVPRAENEPPGRRRFRRGRPRSRRKVAHHQAALAARGGGSRAGVRHPPRSRSSTISWRQRCGLPYLGPPTGRRSARGQPEPGGPIAILGAGTGLGQAGVLSVGGPVRAVSRPRAATSTSGRARLREDGLVRFLRTLYGRATATASSRARGLR